MENNDSHDELQTIVDSLGLRYEAKFVPVKDSRNPESKTLNWKIGIQKYKVTIVSDYTQGCAFIPGYEPNVKNMDYYINSVCTTGKAYGSKQKDANGEVLGIKFFKFSTVCKLVSDYRPTYDIPAPPLKEVLMALVYDADVLNYPDYETWAAELGYSTDSILGKAIYTECLGMALKLRYMIGDEVISKLRQIDY